MKIAITILSVFYSLTIFSQNNFRILKVDGCLKTSQSVNCLEKGSVLNGNEILLPDNPDCHATLIDSKGDIFSLKVQDTAAFSGQKEPHFAFADITKKVKSNTDAGVKRGSPGQQITHFNYFFGNEQFTVIGDEARFGVNSLIYPVNKEKYLVFYYRLDTCKVSKRLGFRDQVIRIQKNSLTEFKGNNYNRDKIENVYLYYYQPVTKSAELLSTFDLVFISQQKLIEEFEELYNQFPDKETKTTAQLETAFSDYFESSYGKTEPQALQFVIDEIIAQHTKN